MIKDSFKQIITYGIGSVAQSALAFLLLPLYLHYFEPSEYGVISLLLVATSLLTIFVNVGIVSGLSMLYFEAELGERKKLVGNTWLWYAFGATLGGAILIILSSELSQLLFRTAEYSYPIKLVGIFFFLSLMQEVPFNVFRLEKKSRHYVAFSLVKFIADFGLKLYFIAVLGRGIAGYFESGIIINFLILVSFFPLVLKYVNFSLNTRYLKRLMVLGLPFVFSTFATWILNMSDRFILNNFRGAADVGIYSLAGNFAAIFNIFLSTPFGLFWNPFFLSSAAIMSTTDTKIIIEKVSRYLLVISGVLYLAISLGSGDALLIFTNLFSTKEGYLQAATLLPLLTLGPMFYLVHGIFVQPLYIVKKPSFFAIGSSIAAITNIGLNLLFIPKLGPLGAALSSSLAYALHMVITYFWVQRIYPVNYNLRCLLLTSFILVVALVIGWQIKINQPWISLFVRLTATISIFLIFSWFISGILTDDEKRSLLAHFIDGKEKFMAILFRKS